MGLFQTCSQIGLSSPTWTAATSNKVSDAVTGLFSYTCRDFSGKNINPCNTTLINLVCLVCTLRGKNSPPPPLFSHRLRYFIAQSI